MRLSGALWLGWIGGMLGAGCAPPGASEPIEIGGGDGGLPVLSPSEIASRSALRAPSNTPAPAIDLVQRREAPSGMLCSIGHAPGDCDRCPERACVQVLVLTASGEAEWAPFCEQGDVREEAFIACLCAGGNPTACVRASQQTAGALVLVDTVFGGRVPPVGTRYRDAYGLRAHVDEEMHDWLASVSSAPALLRCDEPDRAGAETRYVRRSNLVRTTGRCEE